MKPFKGTRVYSRLTTNPREEWCEDCNSYTDPRLHVCDFGAKGWLFGVVLVTGVIILAVVLW